MIILPEDTDTETIQKVLDNLKNNTDVDVVDVIVGNKIIAENEPLETAQAPVDLGPFSYLFPDWLKYQPIGARAKTFARCFR